MAERNKGSHLTLEDREIIEGAIPSGAVRPALWINLNSDII